MDSDEAIEQAQEICRLIDEDVPEWALDKAPEFFESVREGAADMEETITKSEKATPAQQEALENWEAAVKKWIKD